MASYLARINVMLKPVVNDPQGLAVQDGLGNLGFAGIESVRVGKRIEIRLEANDDAAASAEVHAMCERLLANQVIEDFEFEVSAAAPAG
jgi:phosphoribosylformylglycinamidine synthase PurS subunit